MSVPIALGLAALLAAGAASCRKGGEAGEMGRGGQARNGGQRVVTVETAPVETRGIEEALPLTGDVHGIEEAVVYADVPGKLLKKLKQAGDRVEYKEIVALVDRDEPALQFGPVEVRSPLKGVVAGVFADLGSLVGPQVPILKVADLTRARILVSIAEKDFPRVRMGLPARFTVDALGGRRFEARVSLVPPALDTRTRSAVAEIHLDNPGGTLKPGMFARVEVILSLSRGARVVPRAALLEGIAREGAGAQDSLVIRKDYFVFVIAEGRAIRRDVQVGILTEEWAQITQGIEAGEQVATLGKQNLTDGIAVEIYKP